MAAVHKGVAEGTIPSGTLVVLDFGKMRAVNGSYIKGTAFWLLKCGQLSAGNSEILFPRDMLLIRVLMICLCV